MPISAKPPVAAVIAAMLTPCPTRLAMYPGTPSGSLPANPNVNPLRNSSNRDGFVGAVARFLFTTDSRKLCGSGCTPSSDNRLCEESSSGMSTIIYLLGCLFLFIVVIATMIALLASGLSGVPVFFSIPAITSSGLYTLGLTETSAKAWSTTSSGFSSVVWGVCVEGSDSLCIIESGVARRLDKSKSFVPSGTPKDFIVILAARDNGADK